jgi:hypothetical protein
VSIIIIWTDKTEHKRRKHNHWFRHLVDEGESTGSQLSIPTFLEVSPRYQWNGGIFESQIPGGIICLALLGTPSWVSGSDRGDIFPFVFFACGVAADERPLDRDISRKLEKVIPILIYFPRWRVVCCSLEKQQHGSTKSSKGTIQGHSD